VIYCFSTTVRFFLFTAFLLIINSAVFAQDIVDLDEENFVKLFIKEAYIFQDSSNKITADEILSGKFESKFQKSADDKFYTENLNTNYWLRIKLRNRNADKNWLIEIPDPHVSEIHFYRPNQSGTYEALKVVGFSFPFVNKEYSHKNFLFKTYLPKDSVQTFYVMVNSENYAGLSSYVREEIHFTGYALTEYVLLGLYYGVLLIMSIYNLFLFFNTKDRVYIYYVMYALCCALNSFSEDGLGFQYLWPESPLINVFVSLFTPLLLLSAFMVYSFSFLDIDRTAKSFKNIIIGAYISYILVYFIERFLLDSQRVYQFVFLLPFLLIYIASFKIYFNGEKSARFFILAYTMIIISFIIYLFRIFDLIPVGFGLFAVYSFNFGFLIEVVILSIALSDRFRIERLQRESLQQQAISQLIENESLKNELIVELKEKEIIQDRVNKELESKVALRTKDLQEKSEELSVFNSNLSKLVEDLNQMNIKLDLDNWQLKQKVQEEVKARLSDEELSTEKFKELFPDDTSCMRYLENIKWSNGFICKKCGHDKYITHTSPFTRKCTSCKHVESVTAETLFHGIRIPMDKAFYIVYDTIRSGKSKTLEELSEILGLNKNTVWAFRKKIQSSYELLKSKSKGAVVRWDDLLSH
jgi:hypothetical protein